TSTLFPYTTLFRSPEERKTLQRLRYIRLVIFTFYEIIVRRLFIKKREVSLMIDQKTKEKYAELALQTGVNLQKNQALMINAPIEGADFTRIVARKEYELGAKDVHINCVDDELTLLKYENAPDEVLNTFPEWKVNLHDSFAEDGAAVSSI